MVDGQLRPALVLVPGGGPPVEPVDQLGLATFQLGQQQLAEELVIAIPAATVVQLDKEQLRAGQRLQDPVRSAHLEDRVAQRS